MINIISKTALIDSSVKIANNIEIKDNVQIGKNTVIANNVVIYENCLIGENVRIDDNVVIGKSSLKAANSTLNQKECSGVIIGDFSLIGTSAVIYQGSRIGEKVFIADLATIRERVSIGDETIIGRNTSVENDCKIGKKCKLQTNVYLTAYSKLSDYVFIAPGVVTSNDNYVGRDRERFKHRKGIIIKRGGRIGANVTVLPGKVIGEDSLVAAGSIVTKKTPPAKIVMGCPAEVVGDVPEEQLLKNNLS